VKPHGNDASRKTARPVRADTVWPTAKAVGKGGVRGTEPRQGRHSSQKELMSPLAGLLKQRAISHPSAMALGQTTPALTGLAGTETDTLPYCEAQPELTPVISLISKYTVNPQISPVTPTSLRGTSQSCSALPGGLYSQRRDHLTCCSF